MKFHRHALHLEIPVNEVPSGTVREHGYMFCDLCGCKPTTGTAGEIQCSSLKSVHQEGEQNVGQVTVMEGFTS